MALTNKGLLVVLSGPSGAGKDTVLEEIKNNHLNFEQSVSMTTRKMRDGEVEGVDYYFTDVETFEKNIKENYFLEYVKYGENYYGTPKKKIEELVNNGSDVFLKIEVEGAGNVRKVFPDAVSIFILPPSMDILRKRLMGRGSESEDTYKKRLEIAENEILRAKEYDYVVVNDDISLCAQDICAIIKAEKSRYKNMEDFVNHMKVN